MGVIEKDTSVCRVNKNMVRDKKGWREGIRVFERPYVR